MVITENDKKKVLANIRREHLVQLTREFVDIPSPTGHEANIAKFLVDHMNGIGLKAHLQEIVRAATTQSASCAEPAAV